MDHFTSIFSLIVERGVFDGSFRTTCDVGIAPDGTLKGNISFNVGGLIYVGPTGIVENTPLEANCIFIQSKVADSVLARKALEITGSGMLFGGACYQEVIDIHPRIRRPRHTKKLNVALT